MKENDAEQCGKRDQAQPEYEILLTKTETKTK